MNKTSDKLICTLGCWAVASLSGFLAAALLIVAADWTFLQSMFIAALIFFVAGALLSWLICKPLPPIGTVNPHGAKRAVAPQPAAQSAPAQAPATAEVKSSQLPGEAELAERKGTWSFEGSGNTSDATTESQPETLVGARDGRADNLKLLKGVGPKLEQTLNELGFFHFDQIAKWTEAEVAWVDTRLKFKGRIERDGWIEQAKILAAGGETEFSKRSK
ncbi:hypothetical protein [Aestuariivita sp.]|jgi:predicted flap endonuclease-1-like 5' DNA nuclease|uniref:hypothetical protein n=1 Tax=Aestuariivita sp. TaxID=1872407 RepID=UPI00216E24B5|nr:hypothetical protein [Aestuariivita sp.]MCE8008831.1 hypothetical protein [Aestuariivita sp.]